MKLSILALALGTMLLACGDSTSGNEAGGDAANDSASNDSATSDATTNDAGADAAPTDSGAEAAADGGLKSGDPCDLQNDQCGGGLKCCGGGAQILDAGQGHCIPPTDAGTCPAIP